MYHGSAQQLYPPAIDNSNTISPLAAAQFCSKGGMNLYVSQLPPSFNSSRLREAFAAFGPIHSAKVMYDNQTNESRCFGFVLFYNFADGERAMSEMNGRILETGCGRLHVRIARPSALPQPLRTAGTPVGGVGTFREVHVTSPGDQLPTPQHSTTAAAHFVPAFPVFASESPTMSFAPSLPHANASSQVQSLASQQQQPQLARFQPFFSPTGAPMGFQVVPVPPAATQLAIAFPPPQQILSGTGASPASSMSMNSGVHFVPLSACSSGNIAEPSPKSTLSSSGNATAYPLKRTSQSLGSETLESTAAHSVPLGWIPNGPMVSALPGQLHHPAQ